MRRKILPFILGGALAIGAVAPAAANNHQPVNQGAVQNALVGLILQAAIRDVDVNILNNALNNILQNADIDVLNNSLNNLLQNVNVEDVEITVIGDDVTLVVSILNGVASIIST